MSPNECDNEEATTGRDTYSRGSVIDNSPGEAGGASVPKFAFMRFLYYRNITKYGSLENALSKKDSLTCIED